MVAKDGEIADARCYVGGCQVYLILRSRLSRTADFFLRAELWDRLPLLVLSYTEKYLFGVDLYVTKSSSKGIPA